jgi:hypothetical protein
MSGEGSSFDWNEYQLNVDLLCNHDLYAEALELLNRVQGEATATQLDVVRDIQEFATQVENRRNQRYTTLLTRQINPYLDLDRVDTLDELTVILDTEKTLKQIDPNRAKVELEQKLRKIESNSRSHIEYSDIKSKVDKHLKQAASIARPEEAEREAQKALNYLNKTLDIWNSRDDAIADSVIQRLRSLRSDVTTAVIGYAKRTNILTTAAGQADMWRIEEEYQQWVVQSDAEHTPSRMPKMEWHDITELDGSVQRRYTASGEVLNLQDWHDAFLSDAVQFSREKAERDLRNARFALEQGIPDVAVKEAGKMLGKHEREVRPYFMLPQELKDQAEKFLTSPELVLKLNQMERAISWLGNADSKKGNDPLGALKLFTQALREPVNLGERVGQIRPAIFQAAKRFIDQCIQQDILNFDISPNREQVLDNMFPIESWLQVLPQYESSEDWRNLDPEKALQPVRNKLEQHKLRIALWRRLVLLYKEYRQLALSSVAQRLDETEDEIQRRNFKADEFPLLHKMRNWYENEVDTKKQIQLKLADDGLFPEDIAQTDLKRISEELTTARNNVERHEEFAKLINALEARRQLHRELTQRDILTTELRIDLLKQIEKSEHALPQDKAIAVRQLETINKDKQLREIQLGVINQIRLCAERGTIDGFAEAHRLLNEAASANILLGELLSVRREMITRLDDVLPNIRQRFAEGITKEQQLEEAKQWLDLGRKLGFRAKQQELETLLDPLIWQWHAVHDNNEEKRLDSLLELAKVEKKGNQNLDLPRHHDGQTWKQVATEAARSWIARQLTEWRHMFIEKEKDKALIVEELSQAQQRIREVKPEIESNADYWRQLAELFAWLCDLENAEHYARKSQLAPNGSDAADPTADDIQALLELATYRQKVLGFRSEKLLGLGEAEHIRKEYGRLFSSQPSISTQRG